MPRHKINLLIVFLTTLSFYSYSVRTADANINSRLALVKAVVEERRFTIDSYHQGEFKTNDKAEANGHYYSDKAIGASFLGILIYAPIYSWVGHSLPTDLFIMLLTGLTISIPCALLAPLIYSMAVRVVNEGWIALSIALCISLATQVFPYSSAFYGHSLAALFAFSTFFLWMEINQFNVPITSTRLFLSGFLIGFLVLTEYPALIIAILLIGYVISIIQSKQGYWDWRKIGLFLAGGVVPLILLAVYNWLCFGAPWSLGYANESTESFKELHSVGLLGIGWPNFRTLLYMTIHPMMGIFIQSPVLWLSVGGLVPMLQQRKLRLELLVSTLIILFYLLAISGIRVWWGGNVFTVRYLIPILPFFAVFMFYVPRKYSPLFISIGLVSFVQMLIASSTPYDFLNKVIRDTFNRGFMHSWDTSLLYQYLFPRLLSNKLVLTWSNYLFDTRSWYMNIAPPLLAALILLVVFYFNNRPEATNSVYVASYPTVKSSDET